jgi:hypothetical protein
MKMTSISIARVIKKENAQKFIDKIQNETYMKFNVLVCPAGGGFEVIVETDYTDDQEEAQGMLNLVMFDAINS